MRPNLESWRFLLATMFLVAVISFGAGAYFGRVVACDLEGRPIVTAGHYDGVALYCRIPVSQRGWW